MVKDYTASIKNAEASALMEGYIVTDKMCECCRQVLSGKATTAEVLRRSVAGSNGVE